jgi:hypothetical protein
MIVPLILLVMSLGGVAVALLVPGLSDLTLIAGPMTLASVILLVKARLGAARMHDAPTGRTRKGRHRPKWVVIDGSNVMHWADGTPQIEPLRAVVDTLENAGFTPGVMFDANAGYLIAGRYQHDHDFGKLLGLPEDRIMVVPKGTPADPTILTAARDLGARVVTNDRYRDWAGDFPEIKTPGFLIRGGYEGGALWLDLEETLRRRPARGARATARS